MTLRELTRRRVPEVAFWDDIFGDDSSSTVTIVTPGGGSGGGGSAPPPFVPPPFPEFEGFESPEPSEAFLEMQDHALKAMRGELPIPVALAQDLARQEAILRTSLHQQHGRDYETVTPAMQTLAEFNARKLAVEDAARHGQSGQVNSILQGLVQQEALAQRAAMEEAQFGAEMGMAQYKADLEAAKFNYQQQYGTGGERRETTTEGGGSGAGNALGAAGGIGLAMILGAKGKPWWMGGEEGKAGRGAMVAGDEGDIAPGRDTSAEIYGQALNMSDVAPFQMGNTSPDVLFDDSFAGWNTSDFPGLDAQFGAPWEDIGSNWNLPVVNWDDWGQGWGWEVPGGFDWNSNFNINWDDIGGGWGWEIAPIDLGGFENWGYM